MRLSRLFLKGRFKPMNSGKGVRPPTQMRGVRFTPEMVVVLLAVVFGKRHVL